jgi:uncharacterized membrane protein YgdD (TMEM256/DUF423 family)
MINKKTFLVAAAIGGLTAVVLGAFGAHALRKVLPLENLIIWEKGVQYQFYHSLALYMTYLLLRKEETKYVKNAGWSFIIGIICFSGSLYLLATREITGIPALFLGPVTPIGGFFFIIGWLMILFETTRSTKQDA